MAIPAMSIEEALFCAGAVVVITGAGGALGGARGGSAGGTKIESKVRLVALESDTGVVAPLVLEAPLLEFVTPSDAVVRDCADSLSG